MLFMLEHKISEHQFKNCLNCLGEGCFPPAGYGIGSYYPMAMSDPSRPHVDAVNSNMIDDNYPPPYASSSDVETNLDFIQVASELNCRGFDENCRWSNTNEDELDWTVLISTPQVEPWVTALQTSLIPDSSAAVLISGNRNAWDSGQLVSDTLPCIVSPIQLTATVWRSSVNDPIQQQPNLQICSRNVHSNLPNSNCNIFPIQNGIPVTVNVPEPRDPTTPAQIVLVGDNFVGTYGGALFVQDIFVDGEVLSDCSAEVIPSSTHSDKLLKQQSGRPIPLNSFQDSMDTLVDVQELNSLQEISDWRSSSISQFTQPSQMDSAMAVCLKLSCNPAEKDCGWHNGIVGWSIWTRTDSFSNPLTGIVMPPSGSKGFLVASYDNNFNSSIHHIISPRITVSTREQPLYFCFYEYFSLGGARFAICVDKFGKRCFYSKTDILNDNHVKESRRWNLKCAELPVGTYQIHVLAENKGPNKGEIGFMPLRVSRDLAGNDVVC
ncbi:unnamed protein product [Thelazia callipaeda]|uniref:MAM domain-containing protein n=1 Tax=Thelazia callipaeda TaxID=103827 RepID=A0A0N5CXI0_THECL|nr:unnamed protein product [Thelazia callipaeda]